MGEYGTKSGQGCVWGADTDIDVGLATYFFVKELCEYCSFVRSFMHFPIACDKGFYISSIHNDYYLEFNYFLVNTLIPGRIAPSRN